MLNQITQWYDLHLLYIIWSCLDMAGLVYLLSVKIYYIVASLVLFEAV